MKSILLETISIIEVTLFWAVALPVSAVVFPVLAGWQTLSSLGSQTGSAGPGRLFGGGALASTSR